MMGNNQANNEKGIDHAYTVVLLFVMTNVSKRGDPHKNLICLGKDKRIRKLSLLHRFPMKNIHEKKCENILLFSRGERSRLS